MDGTPIRGADMAGTMVGLARIAFFAFPVLAVLGLLLGRTRTV